MAHKKSPSPKEATRPNRLIKAGKTKKFTPNKRVNKGNGVTLEGNSHEGEKQNGAFNGTTAKLIPFKILIAG